jgi:hypothetical protein
MTRIRAIARALVLLLPVVAAGATAARADMPLAHDERVGEVAGWKIGYSRGLSGCLTSATFTDQTTIWLGFSPKLEFYIAFTNLNWRSIEKNKSYQMRVRPIGYGMWNGGFLGFENGDARGLVIAKLKKDFLLGFAKADGMALLHASGKQVTQLSLAGSKAALVDVLNCQQERLRATASSGAMPKPAAPQPAKAGSGTGFFVSRKGHVLTNAHVAKDCRALEIVQPGQQAMPASLVVADQRSDLALLSTAAKPVAVPAFRTKSRVGEKISVYGFPLAGLLATSGTDPDADFPAVAGLAVVTSQLQISAPVQPGNSGGPLLDKAGNVIGVVVSKLDAINLAQVTKDMTQNVNFAIKSSIAANFLDTNNIEVPGGEATAELDGADIADKAREFTVRVNCK